MSRTYDFSDIGMLFDESVVISIDELKNKDPEIWYDCNLFYNGYDYNHILVVGL